MIDIENDVFTEVFNAVTNSFPNAFIAGEYMESPSDFPCVTLVEMDNVPLKRTQTTESAENHVTVLYEVNIFSNKKKARKAECKAVAKVVDATFERLGFQRTMLNPIPNIRDATIYRMIGRYQAVISKNMNIYRR